NLGTGALREAGSDEHGAFVVTNLLPARYAVLVEAAGFTKLDQPVDLPPGGRVSLDLKLQVGQISQTIEVSAASLSINTEGQTVPLDSVQEINVLTNNFTAEYGRASAGVVNVTTKSGSNALHGTAYEFGRYAALASNTYDNNANGIPKPGFTRNQFGYSVGGPVKKDKLFFFQSTEWLRVRSGATAIVAVPTPQLIGASNANTKGFFSAFGTLRSNF